MSSVVLSGLRKLFGSVEVIKGIDLTVADRELVVFVGPSGCGKSTILRMIAGLEDVDYGRIDIGGQDVTELRLPLEVWRWCSRITRFTRICRPMTTSPTVCAALASPGPR